MERESASHALASQLLICHFHSTQLITNSIAKINQVRQLKREGCRVEFPDDGSMQMYHPCCAPGVDPLKLQVRAFMDTAEKQKLAENYIHNYADDLRDGIYEGTDALAVNLACDHVGPLLSKLLIEKGSHKHVLHFLSQCEKKLAIALKGPVHGDRNKMPHQWMDVLTLIIHHDECPDDIRIMVAKSIEPLVMCIIDERRKLFRRNDLWQKSLESFFVLLDRVLQSDEGCLVMFSYEGVLQFVAQACTWLISREDIVTEASWLQVNISDACYQAQRVMFKVVTICTVGQPLESIASSPLLSNDPNCSDSTLVGFIRTMKVADDGRDLLVCIIEHLVVGDFVDARVIAELIKYGRDNMSVETAGFVLEMMQITLGLSDNHPDIRRSDTRFEVAVRHELLELCFDACDLNLQLEYLDADENAPIVMMKGLVAMALHKKTSRALHERSLEIMLALQDMMILREVIGQTPSLCAEEMLALITESLALGTPTCCNCLKELDSSELRFCNGCETECYCSLSCQSECWEAGHSRCCSKMAKESNYLRRQGISERNIKRIDSLRRKVMASGCKFVQSKRKDIQKLLSEWKQQDLHCMTLVIDFGQSPPHMKLVKQDDDKYPNGLKCEFVSPVFYGFTRQVGKEKMALDKIIPTWWALLA